MAQPTTVLWLSPSTRLRDSVGRDVLVGNKKDLLVLAYLALASPSSVDRSKLARDCWPGVARERARASLRTSLHSLRVLFGDHLEADRETARLTPGALTVCQEPGVFMPEFTEPWVRLQRIRRALNQQREAPVHPVLPAVDYLVEKNPISGLSLLREAAYDLEFVPMGPVYQTVSRLRERLFQDGRPSLEIEVLYHHYREASGLPHASAALLNSLLEDATQSGDQKSVVRLLLLLSCRSVSMNDYDESLSLLRQAYRLATDSTDSLSLMLCRLYAGIALHHGGFCEAAADNDRKMIELIDRRGSDEWLMRVSPFLGVSSDLTPNDWPLFMRMFEGQSSVNHRVSGLPLLTAGWISVAQSDPVEARKHAAAAHLVLTPDSGSPNVNVLDLIAAIATLDGDVSAAGELYRLSTLRRGERQRSVLERRRTAKVRVALRAHPVAEGYLPTATEESVRQWLGLTD